MYSAFDCTGYQFILAFYWLQAGGLDKLTLDSLYEDAMTRQVYSYHTGQVAPNPFEASPMMQPGHDPFYASQKIAPPSAVQMASMAQQQQAFMAQQQMMGPQVLSNPFGNPYTAAYPYATGTPYQAQSGHFLYYIHNTYFEVD